MKLILTACLAAIATSACAQSMTVTSLDVDNVSVFRGSGTVRASVDMETNTYSPGRISALRSLGFFQFGSQWAYQAGNMNYPLVVSLLPRLSYSRGQWKMLSPGKVTKRVAAIPNQFNKR